MSQHGDHPVDPDVSAPPIRPSKWPTVVGVISLIYAIGGLLLTTCFTSGAFLTEFFSAFSGIELEVPQLLKIQALILGVIVLGIGALMLVGAIGLLRRRPIGVRRLKRWVILRLCMLLIGLAVTVLSAPTQVDFQRRVLEMQNEMFRENDMDDRVVEKNDDELWRSLLVTTSVWTGIFAVYPAFLGIFLSRRRVAEEVGTWI